MSQKQNEYSGIVVMIDALGIKNSGMEGARRFIQIRNELTKLFDDHFSQQLIAYDMNFKLPEQIRGELLDIMKDGKTTIKAISEQLNIGPKMLTFQDNFVICQDLKVVNKYTYPYLITLSDALKPFMFYGIKNHILLRGSIAMGDYLYSDEATLLGPAVNDAADWCEMADWCGIVLTPSCGLKYESMYHDKNAPHRAIMEEYAFCEYDVPLKNGTRQNMWSLSWPKMYHGKDNNFTSTRGFFEDLAKFCIPKGTETKYQNTIQFFRYWKENVEKKAKEAAVILNIKN